MSVYVLAQLQIHDQDRYERYAARFRPTLLPYGGQLLAADPDPSLVEGDDAPDKVVLLQFPDAARFHRWARSSEYQAIVADRRQASKATVLLLRGITPSHAEPDQS